MKNLLILSLFLIFAGCAHTYVPPSAIAPNTSQKIVGSPSALLKVTKQILVLEGFQITNSDDSAGVISTAPKDIRLTPELADCGKTMGLDYLKDSRTLSTVGYGVLVSENKVTLKVSITAAYRLTANDIQSIALTCVSKGTLENQLLEKIAAAVKN